MHLGPIIWGFIGALAGFAIGIVISIIVVIRKKKNQLKATNPRAIVIVECEPDQVKNVKEILWTNTAEGVRCLNGSGYIGYPSGEIEDNKLKMST